MYRFSVELDGLICMILAATYDEELPLIGHTSVVSAVIEYAA
jgi:hypothetical protein